MTEQQFINSLEYLGITVSDIQLQQLAKYYDLLIEWNKKINLTGITDHDLAYLKHFYDSLTILKAVNLEDITTICDVGTGAGFPGLVIKIMFPNIKLTLVDSLNKRMKFLKEVIDELELKEVTLVISRAEEYALKNRELFDLVTARAVAPLNILLEYCIPLVKESGYFIALKGNAKEELKSITSAVNELTILLDSVIEFKLPFENSDRTLIRFKKNKVTNNKYPRQYKEILKKPL